MDPKALLDEALRLDPRTRAKLASDLLASIDDGDDDDVEAAWATEVTRRDAELESGRAMPVGLDAVRGRGGSRE
jgi:putative addiction module component (TIGR02574 family)